MALELIKTLPALKNPAKLSTFRNAKYTEVKEVGVLNVKVVRFFDSADVDAYVCKYIAGVIPNPIVGTSYKYGYITINRPKKTFYFSNYVGKYCNLTVRKISNGNVEAYFCSTVSVDTDDWEVPVDTDVSVETEEGGLTI